ncbi:MAG: hypothetical protein ACRCS8_05235 [Brevinema sp.]
MKKLTILFFILTASCTVTPDSIRDLLVNQQSTRLTIEQKTMLYPMFGIGFYGFGASDTDPIYDGPNGMTEEHKRRARTFNVVEKRYMLRNLDLIRFVVNTPEFADALRTNKMRLVRAGSGPLGSNKSGDYADGDRVLNILRHFSYQLRICKRPLANAEAAAPVGKYRYNHDPKSFPTNGISSIFFPSHRYLDQDSYVQDNYYRAGTVLHEIMHNLGFTHGGGISTDVVYGTAGSFKLLAKDPVFMEKYKHELARFRPYYEERFSFLLQKDTYLKDPPPPGFNRSVHVHSESEDPFNDPNATICLLNEDGTYTVMTVREYQLKHKHKH